LHQFVQRYATASTSRDAPDAATAPVQVRHR
jgi:hypothetical protein